MTITLSPTCKNSIWSRFYVKPFEVAVGIFVIINGILTFFPSSTAHIALLETVGWPIGGMLIPILQVVAGSIKLIGIATKKSNLEAAGLIAIAAMFIIRVMSLVSDWSVNITDANNILIALLIVAANTVKINHIYRDYTILYIKEENGSAFK